jgi:hypothetical protein
MTAEILRHEREIRTAGILAVQNAPALFMASRRLRREFLQRSALMAMFKAVAEIPDPRVRVGIYADETCERMAGEIAAAYLDVAE